MPSGAISSRPHSAETIIARSTPDGISARAISSHFDGWNTPTSWRFTPTGLVSGPSMLNSVRTRIARRTGATAFIAG
ncbi:MAG: hypothetical protein U1F37_09715 [Alphaproteobacteria bacterium]